MKKNEFRVKQITPARTSNKVPLDVLSTIKLHLTKEQAVDLIQKMLPYLISDEYQDLLDLTIWRKTKFSDGSYSGTIMCGKKE